MKLHTTLSAILNATALLFKNHFIIIEFFIMRAQTSCASSCRRTGEYLVFIVELPFFCIVYLFFHSSCVESMIAYLMHLRPHAQQ